MTDTLKSVVEDELQKAYERGVQDGMKQERALWRLAEIGQEIEFDITYEEANPLLAQPKKEWVGLTDEDLVDCETEFDVAFARAIEAKLKEKNNG